MGDHAAQVSDGRFQIAAKRLLNQHLVAAPLDDASQVVCLLGAVQAQEYPVARWSLGLRASGLDEAAVDEALAAGDIIRTHVVRDTWHLVCRDDLRWMMGLTRPRIQARNATMYGRLGLNAALLARTETLLADALREHGEMTRTQIRSLLNERGIDTESLRFGYILMNAELELLICSGALRGKSHTYALVDDRVPKSLSLDRDDALAALARRYFTSHGPATRKDFAWWASLTAPDARRGIEQLGGEFVQTEDGGRTYWAADSFSEPVEPAARALLLQGYDEYIIAYSESRDVLDIHKLARLTPAGRITYTHAIVLDGQVVGHWRRKLATSKMTVELQLARQLEQSERVALDEAVERYAGFVGLPVTTSGWSR